VRGAVETCVRQGVEYLTLFAFSSENWRRPQDEVSLLMSLFLLALQREVNKLRDNGVRLRVIGDLSAFNSKLQAAIQAAQDSTAHNTRLNLTIAANYGGRWDIIQAIQQVLLTRPELVQQPLLIDESALSAYLSMNFAPEPDLFIRTGGELRMSNFLLWQLAYTELYFTDEYWPDFDAAAFERAFASYRQRERRFGRTSGQIQMSPC
jgi:undecaprenyl diphosphate synthase